jgi:NAD(P)-dependent dehydrogenase (short-subunit alcohol dehydrogenase family)
MGNGNLPAYVASKHGVVGLSKSVSVTLIAPPPTASVPDIDQPMFSSRTESSLPSTASESMLSARGKSNGLPFVSVLRGNRILLPSTIETPILGDLPQGEAGERRAAERAQEIAMGRIGRPEEIAQCIIFLTSGRSSFVTGTTLAAHGGLRNT